jgi:hypothetical protein
VRAVIEMRVKEVLDAAPRRPPGYVEATLGAGRRFERDGEEWIGFEEEALRGIKTRFGTGESGPIGGCSGCGG